LCRYDLQIGFEGESFMQCRHEFIMNISRDITFAANLMEIHIAKTVENLLAGETFIQRLFEKTVKRKG